MDNSMSDVTQILAQIDAGDTTAASELLPLVYDELRKLAGARMAAENQGHTLQATALVHEAYLRLVKGSQPQHWNSRGHFFGAAAEAMRRILVENARRKAAFRRYIDAGPLERCEISEQGIHSDLELLALHEALDQLASEHPRQAQLVKLRYFAGLTNTQAAEVLGISSRMAYLDWSYAKAWLRVAMSPEEAGTSAKDNEK